VPESFTPDTGLVLTSNYETSSLDAFSVTCPAAMHHNLLVLSGDAALRVLPNHEIIILNRGPESNIVFVDKNFGVRQQTALPNCGPHDVEQVDATRVLVTCYERSVLMLVDGSGVREIALDAFNDSDGVAEIDSILRINGGYVISVQNLSRRQNWQPTRNGRIVLLNEVFDIVDTIDLPCENPFTRLQRFDDETFVLGCVGNFLRADQGAIARVNIVSRKSEIMVAHEVLLGQPLDVHVDDQGMLYALIAVPMPGDPVHTQATRVMAIGSTIATVHSIPGFSLGGLGVAPDGTVYVGNRQNTADAGLWVIHNGMTQGPFKTSLPPADIAIY
jgi:hypothetical protein